MVAAYHWVADNAPDTPALFDDEVLVNLDRLEQEPGLRRVEDFDGHCTYAHTHVPGKRVCG